MCTMPKLRGSWFVAGLLVVAGCSKHDESAETDKAGEKLRAAQSEVTTHSTNVANNARDIEQRKRDLAREQQELTDKQKLLEQQQSALGSAKGSLQEARAAYAAAITERLAKLDALRATLAMRTDAKSTDASTGLRARRDQLATKLAGMTGTADVGWEAYTKDVDVTFDAIERDLHDALK